MTEKIIFADVEGDDFLEGITQLWTIQIAESVDGDVEVYADQPGFKPLSTGLDILKNADKIVIHYGLGFDLWAINKLYPNTLRWDQVIDSVVVSRLMNATSRRHSLKEMGELLGFKKGDHSDFSKFSQEMVTYGIQDVKILQKMWIGDKTRGFPSFGEFYTRFRQACDLEMHTAYVIEKQIQHGFRFDETGAYELEANLRVESAALEKTLQEAFPPIVFERWSEKTGKRLKDGCDTFNPSSRQQIAERLKNKYGWKPEVITKKSGDPKIDEEILIKLPYPEAKLIAEYMTIDKKLGQLSNGQGAWLKASVKDKDGNARVHGYVNPIGCRTHRMAHSGPNMANVNKDPRMRCLWLPDPDEYLIGMDAEGLELRELAHFLYPYDNGRYVEIVHNGDKSKGTDIHSQNRIASGLFLRDSAKTMIYAHNYGCFDKKLGILVKDDAREAGQPIPKGSDSAIGAELRAKISTGIVGLGELIEKCGRMHDKRLALPGHDGRWIPSASKHSALNTLLQGNGSIVMKQALINFDTEITKLQLEDKVHYCANVHDEIQLSVHPDLVKETGLNAEGKMTYSSVVIDEGLKAFVRAGEILEIRCPIVGSADVGQNWAETH